MRNAVVVLVVVAGLAGCSSSEPPPSVGDGLAREVATAEGAMTSVSALVYGQAVAGLHDQLAVHTDFRLTVAGRDSTGSLELDVASGSFGAAVETEGADVEVIVADGEHFRLEGAGGDWIHQADDVALSVARVLGFATFADLGLSEIGDLIVDPGSHPQSLDTRLGSYGFEEGHRLV
ncbi:MAG: hypothetical protein OEW85_03695, partial [Acidimicrobiia bacterium]|nr:hypothetical protein [Acidimicrobiia bacterium]